MRHFTEALPDGDDAWRRNLQAILNFGAEVSPRGLKTKEILHVNNVLVDMKRPMVTTKERKLNYRFMAAEALWILAGRNDLESLTEYVPHMADFSDNGEVLAGAYGPRIVPQIPYVVDCLVRDRDTRQAVLTIWTPNPAPSKDIPCTVSMCFSIRQDQLHLHAYMRSSDGWLGIPYDIFSFSMVGIRVAQLYNNGYRPKEIEPGILTISMTSSHLYELDWEKAEEILELPKPAKMDPLPRGLSWRDVQDSLVGLRENGDTSTYPWDLRAREPEL